MKQPEDTAFTSGSSHLAQRPPAPVASSLQPAAASPSLPFDAAVIISPFFWNFSDDLWQTTHHIATEFSRALPTIFVEPPPQWNPLAARIRPGNLLRNFVGETVDSSQLNLTVLRRRSLPFGRLDLIRRFSIARDVRALNALLARRGFTRILLWNSLPYWTESFVQDVRHAFSVYHCLDHSERPEETRLIRGADIVLCVSETLRDKHRETNPRTHLLPNGVDFPCFTLSRAPHRAADLPSRGRTIGFVGSIQRHLDLTLIERIAKSFPHDSIVLIGPVFDDEMVRPARDTLHRLRHMSNVAFLGFKPVGDLPSYIGAFDVALVPLLATQFNRSRDPLKFYEYLVGGKPIVITATVPVARRYPDLCYPAGSHEDFLVQLERALNEEAAPSLIARRRAAARAHSWNTLLAEAMALVCREFATHPITRPLVAR